MSNITRSTKNKLEVLFDMDSGYVLDFSNTKLQEYVEDVTDINIYDDKYNLGTGSKANRLRAFWKIESNVLVSKLSLSLLEYWEQRFRLSNPTEDEFKRLYQLKEKSERELFALKDTPSSSFNTNVLAALNLEENFRLLETNIEKLLNDDNPQLALDRMHTYLTTYFRTLCKKHSIDYTDKENINVLYSKYINFLTQSGHFESKMTPSIIKIPVRAFEKFNEVRNNQSFAHSNDVIGYRESKLIIDFSLLTLAYIVDLEKQYNDSEENELPF